MNESEAGLRREIDLLTNLINNHKQKKYRSFSNWQNVRPLSYQNGRVWRASNRNPLNAQSGTSIVPNTVKPAVKPQCPMIPIHGSSNPISRNPAGVSQSTGAKPATLSRYRIVRKPPTPPKVPGLRTIANPTQGPSKQNTCLSKYKVVRKAVASPKLPKPNLRAAQHPLKQNTRYKIVRKAPTPARVPLGTRTRVQNTAISVQSKYKLVRKAATKRKSVESSGNTVTKRTRYKMVKCPNLPKTRTTPARFVVLRTRHKLVKKSRFEQKVGFSWDKNPASVTYRNSISRSLACIGGIWYKKSPTTLTKTATDRKTKLISVRGVSFVMDPARKTLKRAVCSKGTVASPSQVYFGGRTYVQTQKGVFTAKQTTYAKSLASRAVERSIRQLSRSKTNQLCLFFSRFGRCNRKERCPYVHDPDKVAVCTRFLKGSCTVEGCPFSHRVQRDRMPVCTFFLRGMCGNSECPYLHVKLNPGAKVCTDFVKGYCSKGQECTDQHVLICPDFTRTGKCEKGKSCRLIHRVRKNHKERKTSSGQSPVCSAVANAKPDEASASDSAALPSFIALETSDSEEDEMEERNALLLTKPRFFQFQS